MALVLWHTMECTKKIMVGARCLVLHHDPPLNPTREGKPSPSGVALSISLERLADLPVLHGFSQVLEETGVEVQGVKFAALENVIFPSGQHYVVVFMKGTATEVRRCLLKCSRPSSLLSWILGCVRRWGCLYVVGRLDLTALTTRLSVCLLLRD
jgi:hypothetical protein